MTNGADSAKTWRSARRRESAVSEADYLAREISDARIAMIRSTAELKDSLRESADLVPWIKKYPWAALGVATVAGFTVAAAITPESGQSFCDKWSSLAREHRPRHVADKTESKHDAAVNEFSMKRTIVGSLFDLAKLLIESLIVAAVRKPSVPSEPDGTQV